ncbi:unnamed protein product [marine sediment metagenome]|uniref:Uncharacterized protein n=1 Tax=marine sediment metagenome TaxID=412755 RepID=X1SJH9_9ZZZZ
MFLVKFANGYIIYVEFYRGKVFFAKMNELLARFANIGCIG